MIDIILILFFILFLFKGYRRGFIAMLLNFASLIVAILSAYLFHGVVADKFMASGLGISLEQKVAAVMQGSDPSKFQTLLPTEQITQSLSHTIAYGIANALSMVLIFLVVLIIAKIVCIFLNFAIKTIRLGFINKLAGVLLGGVNGYIAIYVVIMLLAAISPFNTWLANGMNNSIVVKIIPNPFDLFIAIRGIIT
ncbi:MAG: CvpA family protein [Clostridiales bacterium]|jgi:uncharacterized membrane protein required for colicin V production|nr:CvpA family protein [Clostridiales bacterium]